MADSIDISFNITREQLASFVKDPRTVRDLEAFLRTVREEVPAVISIKVDETRQVLGGDGLTGGGDLSDDRTLAVGAGTGITVTADAVSLADTAVTPGTYGDSSNYPIFTVDQQGRLIAASEIPLPSSVSHPLTITTSGGAAAPVSFDGSAAETIDYSTVGAAKTGAITGSGLTQATGKLLGRTTASTGAIEEISTGSAGVLSLVSGALNVTSAKEWTITFTSAGDAYIPALVAMTIDAGNAAIGTGTLAYAKSTSAAPGTFSSTTLPATLQAGAWLKVSASAITGFVAASLKRTA
jgi:hypothetical protein